MSARSFVRSHRSFRAIRNAIAAAAILAMTGMLSSGQAAEVSSIRSHGASVSFEGTFDDGCKSGTVYLNISANATYSRGGPPVNSPALADIFIFGFNICTQAFFSTSYRGDVQLSTKDSGGVQPPKSATSSGHLPSLEGVDSLTYQLAFRAVGAAIERRTLEHIDIPTSGDPIKLFVNSEGGNVAAIGTIDISTQSLGPITFQGYTAGLTSYRSHLRTITK